MVNAAAIIHMSSLEDGPQKTAGVCRNCGEMYVVHVNPDGDVNPIGITECTCGESNLQIIGKQ